MFARRAYFLLLALTLASSGGCAYEGLCNLRDRLACDYQARHYMGPQCGQFYWSEWFNDPPACCEPCNECGSYKARGGCARSYLRARRQSFFHSLFGPSDCQFGSYPLDHANCGGLAPVPYGPGPGVVGANGPSCTSCGCNGGGGFALGLHNFMDRVLNHGGPTSGCGCRGEAMMDEGPPPTGSYEMSSPAPAVETIPTPAPTRARPTPANPDRQSKRSRMANPVSYEESDAYDDVFEDGEQPLAGPTRILRR